MARLRIMSKNGDDEFPWDVNDEASTKAAREKFDELIGGNYAAFRKEGLSGEQIRTFDPNAEEIVFTRPLVGG